VRTLLFASPPLFPACSSAQVDSSVVRLEPLNPPPPINFVEWDGLVRLCFNRKNKTLCAIFKQKPVLQLFADNLKTHRALMGGIKVNHDGVAGKRGGRLTAIAEIFDLGIVKEKVMSVLRSIKFEDMRSSKMEQDDFMLLLSKFNEAGLHFSH